jgi:hypothetical protein
MVLDKLLEFSDSQGAITATAVSTNLVDLGATNVLKDMGAGEEIWFIVQVDVTGTGTGTLGIQLLTVGLASEATTTPTTPHIHYQSPLIVGTDMEARDTLVSIHLPSSSFLVAVDQPAPGYEQFMFVLYTIAATVGAVKLSAFLLKNPQQNVSYKSGFTF